MKKLSLLRSGKTRFAMIAAFVGIFAVLCVAAQESNIQRTTKSTQSVIATITQDRIRISAPNATVQMRLEVYDELGHKVFDTEQRGGNVLDWFLSGGAGERVSPGNYVCVVTIKNPSGRFSQKLGKLAISADQASMEGIGATALSSLQTQAIGPVEPDSSLILLRAGEIPVATVTAHDGNDGQLTRTRGALSFRLGDFFSGNDREQMRLTEEGNLGIGTAKPRAKLDVAGMIRAREGLMFADGSTLNVNDKGVLTRTSAEGTAPTAVTSTQNQLVKFTDNAGTLGDSALTETGGQVGIGTNAPSSLLHLAGPAGVSAITLNTPGNQRFRFQTVPSVSNWGALTLNANYHAGWFLDETSTNGWFFKLDTRGGNADGPNNGLWLFKIPSGANPHTDEGPVFGVSSSQTYFAGKVGIGNLAPAAKLDVTGDVNTSTQFNIGGNRVLAVTGAGPLANSNTFAGVGAGVATTPFGNDVDGNDNAFFGFQAGVANSAGWRNSFFGSGAGHANTSSWGNSFIGWFAGYSNTSGINNTFLGAGAGNFNQAGSNNAFVGVAAGQANNSGTGNSFYGYDSGYSNTSGHYNTFVGYQAGRANITGSGNTVIGKDAELGANNLNFATAIGSGAVVSSSNTIALGRSDGSDTVQVPGALNAGTFGAGTINAGGQYNLFGNRVLSANGIDNLFVGFGAGSINTANAPFNTFVGVNAGSANTDGGRNAFFGGGAGQMNTFGSFNAFFGVAAGNQNQSANNSFAGFNSGGATTTGGNNSFFGSSAGLVNTVGSNNTIIGASANVGANNLINATAIGANAQVTQSNSLVLGSINGTNSATADTNVGIGTTAPVNVLHLNGNHNDFALTFTNQSNTAGRRGYRIAFDSDRLTFQSATDAGAFLTNQMTIDPATGNVGIGTTAPHARLQVAGGNLYIANPNNLIITSPNGTCWLITISNVGALSSIATPCP